MSSNYHQNIQSSVINNLFNIVNNSNNNNNNNNTSQLGNINLSRNNSSLNSISSQNSNISNIVNNLIYSRMHNNQSVVALTNLSMNPQGIQSSNPTSHHNRSHHFHNISSRPNYYSSSLHSSFKSKSVCQLNCRYCQGVLCRRGMKAILLADTRVELYSTDAAPIGVQLVANDYVTRNCLCQIRDVACLGCGNVVGYHVTQPCEVCMSACNNGHFWMFHNDSVKAKERMDATGQKPLLWAQLALHDKNSSSYDDECDIICR
ncbi:hypothetical protein H8356DRAFT_949663 [Neocallimastix lanati (nom. inval.)]|uniref:Uncharacterized protein n=1 Tax=Neocallimastix californiae TaxID=1754190 RepID=A0A1Y2FGU8_9FUNG|nr:hypothetical protein H8356DRAFT_949663 [Neocallimastix sp. JGI-2020a]ORY82837.1 hypothetical protein LY90DRAFT_663995 [Neocallimastix californiae]|eukprot:ORY82837.1 hypothetical protein LY90DRAFT_663995 [Neocallimastix californiae]